jgi:hypothetical protein
MQSRRAETWEQLLPSKTVLVGEEATRTNYLAFLRLSSQYGIARSEIPECFRTPIRQYSMPPSNFIRNASCEAPQDLPSSPPKRGSTNPSNEHEKLTKFREHVSQRR